MDQNVAFLENKNVTFCVKKYKLGVDKQNTRVYNLIQLHRRPMEGCRKVTFVRRRNNTLRYFCCRNIVCFASLRAAKELFS